WRVAGVDIDSGGYGRFGSRGAAAAADEPGTEGTDDDRRNRRGAVRPGRHRGPVMEPSLGRVLVIVPTYNERENLPMITGRLRAAVPDAHILIADDASPDGTGQAADALAAADDHIHVLHRPGKQGLGAAYIAGFRWGLSQGFDVLVEIDADGSHQPE